VRFSNQPADADRSALSREERVELWPHFADDVRALEALLGRDLSAWDPTNA
jgi:hypothetical protein